MNTIRSSFLFFSTENLGVLERRRLFSLFKFLVTLCVIFSSFLLNTVKPSRERVLGQRMRQSHPTGFFFFLSFDFSRRVKFLPVLCWLLAAAFT